MAQSGEEPTSFWRDPPWWFRDGVLALAIGALLVWSQAAIDSRASERELAVEALRVERAEELETTRATRAERLENLRFVRERSSPKALESRPFAGIDLVGQNMTGLQLTRADFSEALLRDARFDESLLPFSDFSLADLRDAQFGQARLFATKFDEAKLDGADLAFADLREADFSHSSMGGVDLAYAALNGANLSSTKDLARSSVRGACHSRSTVWPQGFDPPASRDLRQCLEPAESFVLIHEIE